MVKAVTPIPFVKARFFDRCGKPLSGGKVYTYDANTTTDKATYKDPYGLTPNTNPVVLDAAGEADIYLEGTYRIRITDRQDVLVNDVAKIGSWFSDNLQDTLNDISGAMSATMQPIINALTSLEAGKNGWTDLLVQTQNGRTQADKNNDTICVKDFGVVGDGVTDDTQAFYTAVNAQSFFIPQGNYKISDLNVLTNNWLSNNACALINGASLPFGDFYQDTVLNVPSVFPTINAAVQYIKNRVIRNNALVTIQVAVGTYTESINLSGVTCTITGAGSNTIVQSSGDIFTVDNANVTLTNLLLQSVTGSAGGFGIIATNKAKVLFSGITFGKILGTAHIHANLGGNITAIGNYAITGDAAAFHIWVRGSGSNVTITGRTITLNNTPNFAWFVYVEEVGELYAYACNFIGGATGGRFCVVQNAVINTDTNNVKYFPGTVNPSMPTDQPNTGGRYDSIPDYGFTTIMSVNITSPTQFIELIGQKFNFDFIPDCYTQILVKWSGLVQDTVNSTMQIVVHTADQADYCRDAAFYQITDTVNTTIERPSKASLINAKPKINGGGASYGSITVNNFHGGAYAVFNGNYTDAANNFHSVQGIFLNPNWWKWIRVECIGGSFTAGEVELIAVY